VFEGVLKSSIWTLLVLLFVGCTVRNYAGRSSLDRVFVAERRLIAMLSEVGRFWFGLFHSLPRLLAVLVIGLGRGWIHSVGAPIIRTQEYVRVFGYSPSEARQVECVIGLVLSFESSGLDFDNDRNGRRPSASIGFRPDSWSPPANSSYGVKALVCSTQAFAVICTMIVTIARYSSAAGLGSSYRARRLLSTPELLRFVAI